MTNKYKLIAGLGNPGEKYEHTYHNIGFVALGMLQAELARKFRLPDAKWNEHKKSGTLVMQLPNVTLVQPTNFMNISGEGISKALRYFNARPENMLIMHDDIDLTIGDIRLEFGRGAGGHHGVESIINHLGTKGFWRMRIGIQASGGDTKAEHKVLSKIRKEERDIIYSALERAIEKVIEKI